MFELFLLGLLLLFAGTAVLKILGLFLALLFTGAGFMIKIILFSILALLFFPLSLVLLGTLVSGGFIGIIFILLGAGLIFS